MNFNLWLGVPLFFTEIQNQEVENKDLKAATASYSSTCLFTEDEASRTKAAYQSIVFHDKRWF